MDKTMRNRLVTWLRKWVGNTEQKEDDEHTEALKRLVETPDFQLFREILMAKYAAMVRQMLIADEGKVEYIRGGANVLNRILVMTVDKNNSDNLW